MYEKYPLCGLALAVAFAVTYTSSPMSFPVADLWGTAALGLAVNAFLLLGVRLLCRWSTTVENGFLAAIVTGGVVTSYVLYTGTYWSVGLPLLLLMLCGVYLLTFTLLQAAERTRRGGIFLLVALGVCLVGILAEHHLAKQRMICDDPVVAPAAAAFRARPNLYFVSFDAIVPRSILRSHLQVESTAFHDVVDERMRRFANFFSVSTKTLDALTSILALRVEQDLGGGGGLARTLFGGAGTRRCCRLRTTTTIRSTRSTTAATLVIAGVLLSTTTSTFGSARCAM